MSTVTIWRDGALIEADAGSLDLPPPGALVEPVPSSISDRQFFQQLAVEGVISEDEALAAVTVGAIPPVLVSIIDGLPAERRFSAKMKIAGAKSFERADPLTAVIGEARGMTTEEVDAFFRAAAAL